MREVARQIEFLFLPLGETGSGAVRYGAAMHLYQKQLITDEVLEIYRICAPDDWLDPLAELARLGIANDTIRLKEIVS